MMRTLLCAKSSLSKFLSICTLLLFILFLQKAYFEKRNNASDLSIPSENRRTREKVSFGEESNDGCRSNVLALPEWMQRGKVLNVTQNAEQSVTPRYHIGVLSSLKYLDTRAIDLYHTWGKEAQSMSFYIGNSVKTHHSNLPVTVLKDANDTSYPPQKKGFSLLKYWCDHYLGEYDWFLKVDDDSYLKVKFLEKLLTGLDPSIKYYIGRSGSGLKHEVHLLGLFGNTFCCGPTVIYSKAVLQGVCPHLDTCLSEVVTKHEDTEIGRCMISKMGLQCSTSHKNILKELFYQTYNKEYYKGDLSNNEQYTKAISVHEVKSSQDMYNLHYYYRETMGNATAVPSLPKSNPLSIKPSKAKVTKKMCQKVKCTVPVNEKNSK